MGAPLTQTQALLTNIRLGLKSLQEKKKILMEFKLHRLYLAFFQFSQMPALTVPNGTPLQTKATFFAH
jgi:hypothetical protein